MEAERRGNDARKWSQLGGAELKLTIKITPPLISLRVTYQSQTTEQWLRQTPGAHHSDKISVIHCVTDPHKNQLTSASKFGEHMYQRHLNGFSHTNLNLLPNSLSMPRVPECEVLGIPTYIEKYVRRALHPTSRQEAYLLGESVNKRSIVTKMTSKMHSVAIPLANGATAGPTRRACR